MDNLNIESYKQIVHDWILQRPKEGRGELKRISEFLGVSSVLVSQIFNGEKDISLEQGHKLCDYLGMNEIEKKYFLTLIQYQRAGTSDLKNFFYKEAKRIEKEIADISNRVPHQQKLSNEDKSIFYSDFKYSAIRLACSLPQVNDQKLQSLFDIDQNSLSRYTEFLLERNLIKKSAGFYELGPASTHIGKDTPYVKQHHTNWRLKAVATIEQMQDDELMYTAPAAISKEDFKNLRLKILKLIDEFVADAIESEAEDLFYLNIDLRKVF